MRAPAPGEHERQHNDLDAQAPSDTAKPGQIRASASPARARGGRHEADRDVDAQQHAPRERDEPGARVERARD
jgi:hypothetical protein